jgi:hypothetical protein
MNQPSNQNKILETKIKRNNSSFKCFDILGFSGVFGGLSILKKKWRNFGG